MGEMKELAKKIKDKYWLDMLLAIQTRDLNGFKIYNKAIAQAKLGYLDELKEKYGYKINLEEEDEFEILITDEEIEKERKELQGEVQDE